MSLLHLSGFALDSVVALQHLYHHHCLHHCLHAQHCPRYLPDNTLLPLLWQCGNARPDPYLPDSRPFPRDVTGYRARGNSMSRSRATGRVHGENTGLQDLARGSSDRKGQAIGRNIPHSTVVILQDLPPRPLINGASPSQRHSMSQSELRW
jgi:hypothetical protein